MYPHYKDAYRKTQGNESFIIKLQLSPFTIISTILVTIVHSTITIHQYLLNSIIIMPLDCHALPYKEKSVHNINISYKCITTTFIKQWDNLLARRTLDFLVLTCQYFFVNKKTISR